MSSVLFLGVPSHGHVNPTIGLVAELVRRGERVTYFASEPFRERIEGAGAGFRAYAADIDMFKAPRAERAADGVPTFLRAIQSGRAVIQDVLEQTEGERFDYLVHSAAFPFAKPMAQILGVPTVSSFAVFLGLEGFMEAAQRANGPFSSPLLGGIYREAAREMAEAFGVTLPENPLGLLLNEGDLNLLYTSRLFAGDIPYADGRYRFVGPPVAERVETVEFPFERLEGRRVLYVSLGTVFGGHDLRLYALFFEAFEDWDGVVVLAAHGVDQGALSPPENFVVRDYVPQVEIVRRADVAITHCGMNSMNDLLTGGVPFVCLPLGADQPLLAARCAELGATIVLDHGTVTPSELREAVERVGTDPSYRVGIARIAESFREAGGYPRAVDEVFALKAAQGIGG